MTSVIPAGRLLLALGLSLAIVLISPFAGYARNVLRDAFPLGFVPLLVSAVVGFVVATVVWAAVRIRQARLIRFAGLALAVAIFAAYVLLFRTGHPEVDAVERFHFIEYGVIAAAYYRAFSPLGHATSVAFTLLAGLIVSVFEEWLQWLVPIRVGVAEDIALNLVALLSGILFSAALEAPRPVVWRIAPRWRRRLGFTAAAATLAFGGFFHCAHLGYEIADAEIGRFRSYFTEDELLRLRDARAREWRADPPRELKLLAIEDYYLTEAGWHVQARNEAEARARYRLAALENRIAEKYYGPFLDIDSFLGRGPHRWTPEHRAVVDRAGNVRPAEDYDSQVLRDRIVTRPTKPAFWTLVGLTAGILAALSRLVSERRLL